MATYNGDNEVKMRQDSEGRPIGADRKMFTRALIWAGIALFVILVGAIFIARPAAKKIQPVTPNGRSAVQAMHIQQYA